MTTPTTEHHLTPIALGVRDAGAALGISPRTVERLAQTGELPSFTVGRRRLFSRAALEAWVQRQQEQAQGGEAP